MSVTIVRSYRLVVIPEKDHALRAGLITSGERLSKPTLFALNRGRPLSVTQRDKVDACLLQLGFKSGEDYEWQDSTLESA